LGRYPRRCLVESWRLARRDANGLPVVRPPAGTRLAGTRSARGEAAARSSDRGTFRTPNPPGLSPDNWTSGVFLRRFSRYHLLSFSSSSLPLLSFSSSSSPLRGSISRFQRPVSRARRLRCRPRLPARRVACAVAPSGDSRFICGARADQDVTRRPVRHRALERTTAARASRPPSRA
jgi:hypothetical protein